MPRRKNWRNHDTAGEQSWGNRKNTRIQSTGDETEERMRPPPGLKGRALGLFYRDCKRQRKKCPKEQILKLNIPSPVITKVENNLHTIEKLAKEKCINISAKRLTEYSEPVKQDVKSPIVKEEIVEVKEEHTNSTQESAFVKPQDKEIVEVKEEHINSTQQSAFVKPQDKHGEDIKAGTSSTPDYIPVPPNIPSDYGSEPRLLSLRGAGDYKYSYEDIITGTFDQKLEECLSKKVHINEKTNDTIDLSVAMKKDHENMFKSPQYKQLLEFRKKLPTYTKSQELLDVINSNQVVVISGETGCGKSTQVPQIILDDAIVNQRGAYVKILVTQPRRIAAISLARRVARERGEEMGLSVGYSIRLEKVDCRNRGSITFCTTGILLVDLEMNQGLTDYSHIILDEVHERDTHIDLAMCMLKKVLSLRSDLKLILMSATIDADKLSTYFDNCPMMHIEGLAYPVKDIYLEEIVQMIQYRLPENNNKSSQPWHAYKKKGKRQDHITEKEIQFRAEVGPWLESIKSKLDLNVYRTLLDPRIEDLNIDLIVNLLMHICRGEPGAVLVFLPGIGDITKLLREMEISNAFPRSNFEIYPLHSKLSTIEQHKIFERPPNHIRKIIVATNIAETSITIDDIVYVIDCGKLKYNGLNVEQNISTLQTAWMSQANLRQRRGRAGRCQPGICYHLLTSYRANKLDERILPELQRSNLLEPVLSIKRLRLGKAEIALTLVPDPPVLTTVQWAVKHLQQCGALDDRETLTPLGWHLARLPVHPAAGKLLLLGSLFGCLDRAASVAAVWSFKDPFLLVIGKEKEVERAKRQLTLGEPSDHVAMSEAIIQWEKQPHAHRRSFAYDNFLSNNTLELLSDMKNQLGDNLKQMGFLTSGNVKSSWENRNSDNLSLFKAIVAASLYPNIGTVRWLGRRSPKQNVRIKAYTPEDGKTELHPSSIMFAHPGKGPGSRSLMCKKYGANWLVYWLKQRSTKLFLIDVTLVYTLPLLFFGELNVLEIQGDHVHMMISKHKVECLRQTADLLIKLRGLLDDVLAEKIKVNSNHAVQHSAFEEQVLNVVIDLITAEDECVDYYEEFDTSESEGNECNPNLIMF